MSKQTVVIIGEKARKKAAAEKHDQRKKITLREIRDQPSDFVGKFELAHYYQAHIQSVGKWIKAGKIPPPFDQPGERHPVWKREHYEEYKRTGSWPEAAWKKK
jgi:hypothetical protein